MNKKSISYSLLIWASGLIVGNLMLLPFLGVKLMPLALGFSGAGSVIPLFILMFVVRFLLGAKMSSSTKVFWLCLFCVSATILPIAILFGVIVNEFEPESIIYAAPYIIGLLIGVFAGKRKFVDRSHHATQSFTNLIDEIGN
ncbi:MAG: hypothetical protein AB8F95_04465 [Bacteroidia bacterium]